ncbi:MAG: RES family NAD+ phosphorylase [Candidatus Hydrogenedentes bacterium]|nr:RES family NAD+ phosphorylase [Candidatus Hydrogenedentota bacterium]
MPTTWRIVQTRYAETAFDGEGARLYGGRWNHPGTPIVYTASTRALALLELLVHLHSEALLGRWVQIPVTFEDKHVERLSPRQLPEDWRSGMAVGTRDIGTGWAKSGKSLVLAVPSVIVPAEMNYLINPRHPDAGKLRVGKAEPVEIDPRLG